MDYCVLVDMATELGLCLAQCGAETYRVEESINRIMAAYGVKAEAYALPNCLTVSVESPDGTPITRMKRVVQQGSDVDAIERFSDLSRKICKQTPDVATALSWIHNASNTRRYYPLIIYLLGNFLGAFGFSILFGGHLSECIFAGLCGIIIGIVNRTSEKFNVNQFFCIICASLLMAIFAYLSGALGFIKGVDAVIIGALMILVPGWLFTNALRDIIYGDTNSGINRIVKVFLIAIAIALGTGVAWKFISVRMAAPAASVAVANPLFVECIFAFIGCIGFAILYNIHGGGILLCALGGMLTWLIYKITLQLGQSDIFAYFIATVFCSVYSEIMARIRKCPAISFLLPSAFPLIPGAGVYYTMNFAVRGDMPNFASTGMHTIAIAGIMAVGILLGSTIFKLYSISIQQKKERV